MERKFLTNVKYLLNNHLICSAKLTLQPFPVKCCRHEELVIQENRKEIVIFVGRDVDDTIIKLRELKDLEENSSSSIKITIDGVVDSDAQLKKLENALDELSVESEMKVKSVERNCIELVVEIDNCYFKDKQKLLQAVLKFFTCLQEKQAFKWKGNKVTIVITIDEGFDEQDIMEEDKGNTSLVVENTKHFEEADNEALLELADQHINNGKQQRAKTTIAKLLARLDKEFNVTKGSKRTDLSEIMNACHTKRIGKQYKKCSLLLMKISGGVFDALRSYYTGLVCCGNPDLYEHEKLSSHIWKTIQAVGIHNLKSDNIQTDENYDSENTSSKDSGYSYFSHIDLVEFTNIDSKATFEVRSIADSQYSASSSVSTKSHRQKVRRKTKSLRNKKHLPMQNLPVCQSSKNDVIINWIDDCFQSMTSDQYQRAETAENIEDLNLNSNQGNQEIRYCEGDNLSENMSDVSTCTLSLTGVSADEFSGSEYDISVSDCDWYSLGSDIEEESVYNEENISEEQTYYERSILYHSGEIKARNILEEEYFQKGLDLNDEWIESVGSQYFKRKNNIYNEILNKNFHQESICKPVETKDEIQEIYIAGRSKCGQTFTDDTVVVKIYSKQYLGKVHGEVVSLLDRHRYKDMKHPVFVCLLDWKEGYLMKTLCRTVPKLHVLHSKVDERFNKSRVEIYNYDAINGILNFSHFHDVQEGEREQWLFIVAFIKWKPNRIYPLAAVIGVIHCSQNPYDGIRIMSKEHQVPYFYQKSTVEGTQAAVEKNRAFDVTNYIDRSNTLRIFTIDPPGSKDLDDAFSVMMRIDGSYVVGIHITDVTTIVKKDDLVDIEAKARCVTFYPGKGFRPFAMLPEPLSERICSLLPNQKRPVISVYFKFNSKGELAVTEPTIQKSIIRSCKQFTYKEVQNILDDKLEKQQIELLHDVKMLYKLSKRLKENRLGMLRFHCQLK
ncbi:unnamed protein product [Mytilus edulis]|uniref:RNB domain-containing protein n=1 Tax=Mytilus edulis TaxID=6550 RepID=A0A8S3V161_MYTED|nr:unnamed protein product [Mytilus edulis]